MLKYVLRHAGAGIADGNLDIVAGRDFVGEVIEPIRCAKVLTTDIELAAIGHGVAGIDRQVQHGVFQLPGIGGDRPQSVGQMGGDLDRLAKRAFEESKQAWKEFVQINRLRLQRLLPGEGEQPLRQLGAARGGSIDCVQHLVSANLVLEKFDIAEDNRQQVVEVVRNAAGELADRFQPLGAPQRFFCLALIGYIAIDRANADGGAIGPEHGEFGDDQGVQFAVGERNFVLNLPGLARIEHVTVERGEEFGGFLGKNIVGRFPA